MEKLLQIGRTLVWYGLRPTLLPELWRQTVFAVRGKRPYLREEAYAYCQEHGVDISQVLRLLGLPIRLDEIRAELKKPVDLANDKIWKISGLMGGGASTELLFALVRGIKARHIVETGVAFGWSSLAILLASYQNPDSRLVSIDMPYVKRNTDRIVGLAVPMDLRDRWTLIRRAD